MLRSQEYTIGAWIRWKLHPQEVLAVDLVSIPLNPKNDGTKSTICKPKIMPR